MPADVISAQIEAVLVDLPIASVKTGVIAIPAIVSAVAGLAAAGRLPNLVGDPAMVASSGHRLLEPGAEALYIEALLPHASLLTPNLREAEVLLGTPIGTGCKRTRGHTPWASTRLLRFARPPWLTKPGPRTIKCHH